MLQIIKPHKMTYGISVFANCQRLRPRCGFAYLATIGCQRSCSAASDSFRFLLIVLPSVLGLNVRSPLAKCLFENPDVRQYEWVHNIIVNKCTGFIRFWINIGIENTRTKPKNFEEYSGAQILQWVDTFLIINIFMNYFIELHSLTLKPYRSITSFA